MAVFAVYIEKETSYRGEQKSFGNTYHFETSPTQVFNDQAVADQVKALEERVTSNKVTFTGWRTWGPTDGPAFENVIRETGELSGTGTNPSPSGMYKEACVLVVWPMPRSEVTNRRRWLRKFLRMGSVGTSITAEMAAGSERMDDTIRQLFLDEYATPLLSIQSSVDDLTLVSEDGVASDQPPVIRPYYFTRQIGQ